MNLIKKNLSGINLKRLPQLPLGIPAIRHGYLPDVNKFPCIINFSHILRWMHTNWPMSKMDVRRLEQYLFMVTMDKYDNSYVKNHRWKDWMAPAGGCSEAWKNGIVGRNFDWYYDATPTFMLRVHGNAKRYSSIGIATGNDMLPQEIETGNWLDAYKQLPYLTMDGVNEKGVYAGLNVVNAMPGTREMWAGTEYFGEEAIRIALDTCATAQEAAEMVRDKTFMPTNFHNYEFHFLIADTEHCFVIEDGVMTDETNSHPIITNCRQRFADAYTNGKLDATKLVEHDPYGAGVERFNKLVDGLPNVENVDDMINLMHELNYSNAYLEDSGWLSEVCADYRPMGFDLDLTVDKTVTAPDQFAPVMEIMREKFAQRTREGGDTWQTVHSSVYDLEKKELYLTVQEGQTVRKFALDPFVYK